MYYFLAILFFLIVYIFILNSKVNKLEELNSSYTPKINEYTSKIDEYSSKIAEFEKKENLRKEELNRFLTENVNFFPFLAGAISDYLTYDLELLARSLDWGHSVERQKKVASIREIRNDTKNRIAEAKVAVYQLEYLRKLYPVLDDVLETNYNEITFKPSITDYDPIRNYLSKEEWDNLSETQKNQRALDNYVNSHKKNSWQIGRDYELYVGYKYSQLGFYVDYYGSFNGLDDLGRDLIAKRGNKTLIIQCKYWSQYKVIHEKHINQLYGTTVSYCIENNLPQNSVVPIFITNTKLSEKAKLFAERLNILYKEDFPISDFPRIKCNIKNGNYIYHLPMDQQYDKVKIDKPGEFFAFTVEQAEKAGFRRAYRWHNN